ncbi:hypothetical protein BCR44DRAFT_1423493 [Catenaria anguillulae PL171]|uniref:Uncharacterized protein n=1 Tax=Catenaria anguillulae PL171 TaxID=765915 RepID=A0A1Y2I1A6_9FUNG|nr:hypothetical protein BCR44DRAFT_1423493 [Catenaria anguillulae PL171]
MKMMARMVASAPSKALDAWLASWPVEGSVGASLLCGMGIAIADMTKDMRKNNTAFILAFGASRYMA